MHGNKRCYHTIGKWKFLCHFAFDQGVGSLVNQLACMCTQHKKVQVHTNIYLVLRQVRPVLCSLTPPEGMPFG